MQLSVLVVSYNVRPLLTACLDSIAPDTDIIVVDNASNDGSAEMVAERFADRVRLVASRTNDGFGAAVNRAAAMARGDALLLLNPDAALQPHSQSRMLQALADRPTVGAVGFRQVDADGRFQLSLGPPPWLWAELVRKLVQRRLDAGDLWLAHSLDRWLSRSLPVPWVAASSMLVRRAAFEAVGGFDTDFFLFFEDIDLCLRLRRAGYGVVYDPSVTVIHRRGASAAVDHEATRQAYRTSQLAFWNKHRGPWVRRLVHTYLSLRGALPPEEV